MEVTGLPLLGSRAGLVSPRVDDFDEQPHEVLYVGTDEREIVFNSSCGNHPVRSVEWRSPQLALTIQQAPPVGDGMSNRENGESSAQFADRHNAQVEQPLVSRVTQFPTCGSGRARISSERTLVSSRKPFTIDPPDVRWRDCG